MKNHVKTLHGGEKAQRWRFSTYRREREMIHSGELELKLEVARKPIYAASEVDHGTGGGWLQPTVVVHA